jgi:hypothetical protein
LDRTHHADACCFQTEYGGCSNTQGDGEQRCRGRRQKAFGEC